MQPSISSSINEYISTDSDDYDGEDSFSSEKEEKFDDYYGNPPDELPDDPDNPDDTNVPSLYQPFNQRFEEPPRIEHLYPPTAERVVDNTLDPTDKQLAYLNSLRSGGSVDSDYLPTLHALTRLTQRLMFYTRDSMNKASIVILERDPTGEALFNEFMSKDFFNGVFNEITFEKLFNSNVRLFNHNEALLMKIQLLEDELELGVFHQEGGMCLNRRLINMLAIGHKDLMLLTKQNALLTKMLKAK